MCAWRQEQHIDQLADEEFPELPAVRQYYPQFFHKTDRWGRPVWIELLGHIDVDAMLKVWSGEGVWAECVEGVGVCVMQDRMCVGERSVWAAHAAHTHQQLLLSAPQQPGTFH